MLRLLWSFFFCPIRLFFPIIYLSFYLTCISGPYSHFKVIHFSMPFHCIVESVIITAQAKVSYSMLSSHFKQKLSHLPFCVHVLAKAWHFQIKELNKNFFVFGKCRLFLFKAFFKNWFFDMFVELHGYVKQVFYFMNFTRQTERYRKCPTLEKEPSRYATSQGRSLKFA